MDGEQDGELSRKFVQIIPKTMHCYRTVIRGIAKTEFTVLQFRVLALIYRNGTASNSELADHIGVLAPAMSRIVDKLVCGGYVIRTGGAKDRRKISLTLTALGKKKYERMRAATRLKFEEHFKNLGSQKKRDLEKGLIVLEEIFGK